MTDQDDGSITLPETIVVGDPLRDTPMAEIDWFGEGFLFGWNNSGAKAEAPAPLAQPLLDAYFDGVAAGRKQRTGFDGYDGPSIGPDPGGVPWDEFQKGLREALDDVFHKHEPHTDPEPVEIEFAD